jgi:uncharacterized protein (TIGR02266 family)
MTSDPYGGPERRTRPRAPVVFDSELRLADGPVLHGQLMDLSSGGAFVRTARPLPIGTDVRLALHRGHQRNPLVLDARVVRVGTHAEGRAPGVGLRFHGLTALDEALLRTLIDHFPAAD